VTPAERLAERGLYMCMLDVAAKHHVPLRLALGRDRSASVVRARRACWAELGRLRLSSVEVAALWGVSPSTISKALPGVFRMRHARS
jgi:hypothetical protein